MNKITVIIPNWNGEQYLKTCFDSLRKQIFKHFEVVLIDNGSNDNSVEFTQRNYPEIKIIQLTKNTGFAPAINIGIKSSKTNLIALLNNDTEVDPEWLSELYKATEKYKDAGSFASKMLDFKNRDIVDSCGDAMTWSGRPYKIGELQKDGERFSSFRFVFGACAGAAVYKASLFNKIGGFDGDFKLYLEDVDIDFRAQLAGFKCVFVPKAVVYHIGSATSGKKSAFAFKMMIKNHFHLIHKNFPISMLITKLPKIFYSEFRFFGVALRDGFVKEYFWAIGKSLLEYPKMLHKRKYIQGHRKVSLDYLNSIIDKDFAYKPLNKVLKR